MRTPMLLLALLSAPLAADAQNLIQNPGCEDNGSPPIGWSQISGDFTCATFEPTVPPLGGTELFYAGSSGDGELLQDIDISADADLVDTGSMTADFGGFVRSWPQTPTDESRIVIEYRDSANAMVLDSFDSGNIASIGDWQLVSDRRAVPVGTRFVRIRLLSTVNTGPDNDGYYDDLSLVLSAPVTAVPSLSHYGLGLLAALLLIVSWSTLRRPAG